MATIDPHVVLTRLLAGPQSSGELARAFGVTRQAVHVHLARLRRDGLVRQVGQGRGARWERVYSHVFRWPLGTSASIGEDEMWRQAREGLAAELQGVNEATRGCLNYGATEMLNNAIEHSSGTEVTLGVRIGGDDIELVIADDGVGAFQRVQSQLGLPSDLDAIAHIAKGKQTTAPDRHSGQGIFFTSKVVDRFELDSGDRVWKVDSVRRDQTVGPGSGRLGTRVALTTDRRGVRRLKDVFDEFSDPDTYAMDKGRMRVSLAAHDDEFVSRSEAKRLAAGLELYGHVELDFAGVREVGQGFVDELFRVWPSDHPGTRFSVVNASPEVAFMIDRGLAPR